MISGLLSFQLRKERNFNVSLGARILLIYFFIGWRNDMYERKFYQNLRIVFREGNLLAREPPRS